MDHSRSSLASKMQSNAKWIGIAVFLSGCLVIFGWIFGIEPLKRIYPDLMAMKMNAAICFILIGITLFLLNLETQHPKFRLAGQFLAFIVVLIGVLTIAEYIFKKDLHIDQVIIPELPNAVGTAFPGRMAIFTAFNFFILGLSLILMFRNSSRSPIFFQILAFAALIFGYLSLFGYIYNIAGFPGPVFSTRMALHAAILFVVIPVGILLSRPGEGLTKFLVDKGAGSIMMRRFLPAILLIPPLVELIVFFGQHIGLYSKALEPAYHSLIIILVLLFLVWRAIKSIRSAESETIRERYLSDSILENLPGIFYLFDSQGKFIRWNKNFEKITGYNSDEFKQLSPLDLFQGEEKGYIEKRIQEVFKEGRSDAEANLVSKEGKKFPFFFTGNRIIYEGKLCLIGKGTDISKRKQVEEALKQSERRFRDLAESLPQLVWTCLPDGPCDFLSKQWIEYTGISEVEQLGYGWLNQVHPEDKESLIKSWQESVINENLFDIEFRIRRHDGVYHWFKTRAVPVKDPTGKLIKWFGSNTDFHDLKTAEEDLQEHKEYLEELVIQIRERSAELARSNADLEQFAYIASHDLQEPLRMVSSFLSLLEERYKGKLDSKADEFIHYAVNGAHRMQLLINDLLDFSRVTSLTKPAEEVDSSIVVANAIINMKSRIEETKAVITNTNLPVIFYDGPVLIRVFQNLIDNALKFRSERIPLIDISTETTPAEWIFKVRDNGLGISPQYKEKIFEIFKRLDPGKYPGTGIGLAICKKIIEQHGGKIWVESEEGTGSTFYFTFPRKRDSHENTIGYKTS